MCDCGNIIKHAAVDIFLNEKIKKSFAPNYPINLKTITTNNN